MFNLPSSERRCSQYNAFGLFQHEGAPDETCVGESRNEISCRASAALQVIKALGSYQTTPSELCDPSLMAKD